MRAPWMLGMLVVVACNAPTPPVPRHRAAAPATPAATAAVTTADQAIDALIAAWDREVRPTIPGHRDPLIATIDASMHEAGARARYHAERRPCRAAAATMADLIARSHYDFVLHGSMATAQAHGDCWAVDYVCCMKGDAGALIAPEDGRLLVVWRIPEG